eukprot:3013218-Pyramimonas_sp.AAC.1
MRSIFDLQLKELHKQLQKQRERSMLANRELLLEQVREAWRGRRAQDTARISRRAARCRFGARHRDGRRPGITALSRTEWSAVWQLEGGRGGMRVTQFPVSYTHLTLPTILLV